jgi:ATP-dependent protease HslVU (ClpYQ) peptidase subunit
VTCIVGIAKSGVVYLGGDSASSTPDGESFLPKRPKVFLRGEMAIGVSGNGRVNNLLRYKLTIPPLTTDSERYLIVDFVEALKSLLKEEGRKDDELMEDSFLLVGLRGRLFTIDNTFQVSEMTDDYEAIGSGAQIARGSLYTTGALGLQPRQRLRIALEAAQFHNAFVREPFIFV